jgi:hypothetical protein
MERLGVSRYDSPVVIRLLTCLALAVAVIPLRGQTTDLDDFMARVLSGRDENWKKLQQYIVEERETFQAMGPDGAPVYGFRKEYAWFPRDGIFIRSPTFIDGVPLSDADRRRAEEEWRAREQRRRKSEPGFVSAAYFLRFSFDPGQYALVGRETIEGRDTLRIEYYPTRLFKEGRARPNRQLRRRDADVDEKMNKASTVTLWIDAATHQILQYELDNADLDFLPARWAVRPEGVKVSMRMGEVFRDVWLPRTVSVHFNAVAAIGTVTARYDVEYHDYRLADITFQVR